MKKIPKIVHLYWDGSPMSYLHLLTVVSIHELNPDWRIIVHTPKIKFEGITWRTGEQSVKYTGKDYWPTLTELDYVEIDVFDFDSISISSTIPEVFKSDFIRWYLLSTVGGVWSDFDILYIKPFDSISFEGNMISGTVEELSTAIVYDGFHHIIGFYMSEANNQFFKTIFDKSRTSLIPSGYQSVGSRLVMKLYPTLDKIKMMYNNVSNLPMEVVYPILPSDKTITDLFTSNNIDNYFTDKTIGVHWYNGDRITKEYLNNFESRKDDNTIISNLIKRYDIYSDSLL